MSYYRSLIPQFIDIVNRVYIRFSPMYDGVLHVYEVDHMRFASATLRCLSAASILQYISALIGIRLFAIYRRLFICDCALQFHVSDASAPYHSIDKGLFSCNTFISECMFWLGCTVCLILFTLLCSVYIYEVYLFVLLFSSNVEFCQVCKCAASF